MSFNAINDVTKGLAQLIQSQLRQHVAAAVVTLLPPGDTLPEQTGVNLYLYRVSQSPYMRNDPWPGDRVMPPTDRPVLGVQLHYLLTPLGKSSEASATAGDVSHVMLGAAMLALFENPILNNVHIADFDADTVLSSFLLNSYEQLRVTLSPASVEDVSKIWATINKPYRLSVAYEISLVELVPTTPASAGAGIVITPNITVTPQTPPSISTLTPASGPLATVAGAVVTPAQVVLRGHSLGAPHQLATVQVGGAPVDVVGTPAAPFGELTIALPTDLVAGPDTDIQVRLGGRAADPMTFEVTPWLSTISPIRTALDPALPTDSTLRLTGPALPAAFQVRYQGPTGPHLEVATVAAGEATAPVPAGVVNGSYSVRIQLGTGELSNSRTVVVVPLIDASPVLTVVSGAHHLDVTGARLVGTAITLTVDEIDYVAPANPNPTTLSYQFNRLLGPGDHSVVVAVDGVRSRPVAVTVL